VGAVEAVLYPGRVVKAGHTNQTVVKAIQARLNAVGCGPLPENGVFGLEVENGRLVTEGNTTQVTGSREGIGVFRRDVRKIASINRGFIDYSAF
jgi:hypothetical protein